MKIIKNFFHTVKQHWLVFRICGPVHYFTSFLEPQPVEVKRGWERSNHDVHKMFSLSYASYLTIPRIVLQGMPRWWQSCFVFLMKFIPETPEYTVQRRDKNGKFIKNDPFANYRRGDVEEIMAEYKKKANNDF